jgi:hypothetical protein
MTDVYVPSGTGDAFGTYADVTGVVDATAAGQIAAFKTTFLNLFGTTATGNAAAHPDFNKIPAGVRATMTNEINAMFAAIAAAPTS